MSKVTCPCPFYLYPHSKFAPFMETSVMILQTWQKPHRSPTPRHLKLSLALTSISFTSGMVLVLYSWHLHDVTSLFVHCQASANASLIGPLTAVDGENRGDDCTRYHVHCVVICSWENDSGALTQLYGASFNSLSRASRYWLRGAWTSM
jgi:hypothetical protein